MSSVVLTEQQVGRAILGLLSKVHDLAIFPHPGGKRAICISFDVAHAGAPSLAEAEGRTLSDALRRACEKAGVTL